MASLLRQAVPRQAGPAATPKGAFISSATFRSLQPRFTSPSSILSNRQRSSSHRSRYTPISSKIAPFHSTARNQILPPGPQVIQGGINDPTPVPKPHPTEGSYHWVFERLISIGLVPLTIAPFAAGSVSPTMDAILCATILIHSHIGFQSMVIDYFPTWQVPTARKVAEWLLRIATIVVGVGFYEFETNDVGLTEAIKRVWKA